MYLCVRFSLCLASSFTLMRYSKTITDYCNSYRIAPNDAFFSILAANGCSRAEAYACAFSAGNLQESTLRSRASLLVREKPGVAKLIADLIQQKTVAPVTPPDWETYNATRNRTEPRYKGRKPSDIHDPLDGWNEDEGTAENLERIIKGELPRLTGKDKLDAAFKYAKLKGVDPEVAETTHYYLPLSCCQCSLYKQFKEEKNG